MAAAWSCALTLLRWQNGGEESGNETSRCHGREKVAYKEVTSPKRCVHRSWDKSWLVYQCEEAKAIQITCTWSLEIKTQQKQYR